MKRIFLAILVLISMDAAAQVRLNAYTNYVFDDRVDSYYDANNYYNGKIKGGFQWGAGIEYMVKPNYGIELSYFRQDGTASLKNYAHPITNYNYDLATNYIFLSGTRYIRKPGGKVEGFGGMGLGVAFMHAEDPANGKSDDLTKFAWQFRLGAIIWASETVGIRLQGQLQSAVQGAGGGVYFGTGGAGAGVSTYSSIVQAGLGGGLVFKFHGAASSSTPTTVMPPHQ